MCINSVNNSTIARNQTSIQISASEKIKKYLYNIAQQTLFFHQLNKELTISPRIAGIDILVIKFYGSIILVHLTSVNTIFENKGVANIPQKQIHITKREGSALFTI